jgi:branched-chain amino acid transport system permease protein
MADVIAQGLCVGGLYALIALGFVMVIKSAMVINLAYGAQIMILGYLLYWLVTAGGIAVWLAIPLILLSGILLSLLIERAFVRQVKGGDVLAVMILTLMLGSIAKGVSILIWGAEPYSYPFTPQNLLHLGPVTLFAGQLYSLIAAVATFVALYLFFRFTKTGLAMRVVSWDRQVAESLGMRVRRLLTASWVASGAFSAFCAVLVGMVSLVTPEMDGLILARGFPALLLGGLFSIPGALVGGLIIGVAEKVGGYYVVDYQEMIPWLLMLLILIIRPWGLLGENMARRI